MKIFGYGTFITSGFYQNYSNVRTAYLPGYIRIRRSYDHFPFILKVSPEIGKKGFWGLVFEVTQEELEDLDFYEGSLYERIQVNCLYKDGNSESIMTYYPTQRSIQLYHLRDYVLEIDLWRTKLIVEHPEIIEEFPELSWEYPPNEN